jgi:tetratricopeptide (TPR) repeat protein/V8-like Glu-specific endopeptidase
MIGTVAIGVVHTQVVAAPNPSEVAQVARQITVQIKSGHSGSGSGFIIKQAEQTYTVLTASHVVPNGDQFTVYAPDGKQYDVLPASIKPVTGIDLAIIEFTSPQKYEIAQVGDSSKIQPLSVSYVSGFPLNSLTSIETTYRFSTGQFLAQAMRPFEDGYALAYSNDTFGGMSGGPVLDDKGKVIGIHGRALSEFSNRGINPFTGSKSAVNLSIPINRFLEIAETQFPSLELRNQSNPVAPGSITADDILFQAIEEYTKGNRQASIVRVNEALKLNPNFATAYVFRAYAVRANNMAATDEDYNKALEDINRAIALHLDSSNMYLDRGTLRMATKDFFQGQADVDQAIRMDPNNSLAYAFRGLIKFAFKNYRDALSDGEQAISINPNNTFAYVVIGAAHALLKNKKQALADFDKAIEIDPNFTLTYYLRGETRSAMRDKRGSAADYEQAIKIEPIPNKAYDSIRRLFKSELEN